MEGIDKSLDLALDIFKILISGGEVTKYKNSHIYNEINGEVEEYLEYVAGKFQCEVYRFEGGIYLTPTVDNKLFGYSASNLRNISFIKDSEDVYLFNFIVATIMTAFYKSTRASRFVDYIKISYLTELINTKFEALINREDLEKVDKEYSYNFTAIARKWNKLKDINDLKNSKNRSAKEGIVYNVCYFMQQNSLLIIDKNTEIIACTNRFKAIMENYFEIKENKNKIFEFIEKLNAKDNLN